MVTKKQYIPLRDPYIVDKCKGQKVLHIGPTDWPYTKRKIIRGKLLYKKIDEVCSQQIGIDLDSKGANYLNSMNFKKSKIIVQDMNENFDLGFIPDVIIFSETMEHLMNQGIALNSIKKMMDSETDLIISVPNATYILRFIHALFGSEKQHPDHSAAFSYRIMIQLLEKNDLKVEEFLFTYLAPIDKDLKFRRRFIQKIIRPVTRLFPMLASNLLIHSKLG
jgi:hypothetical protein